MISVRSYSILDPMDDFFDLEHDTLDQSDWMEFNDEFDFTEFFKPQYQNFIRKNYTLDSPMSIDIFQKYQMIWSGIKNASEDQYYKFLGFHIPSRILLSMDEVLPQNAHKRVFHDIVSKLSVVTDDHALIDDFIHYLSFGEVSEKVVNIFFHTLGIRKDFAILRNKAQALKGNSPASHMLRNSFGMFLEFHLITLIMNLRDVNEVENLTNFLGYEIKWLVQKDLCDLDEKNERQYPFLTTSDGEKVTPTIARFKSRYFGTVIITSQFCCIPSEKLVLDHQFVLMIKDLLVGRFGTFASALTSETTDNAEHHSNRLCQLIYHGDRMLAEEGLESYKLIKMIESLSKARLCEISTERSRLHPTFDQFPKFMYSSAQEVITDSLNKNQDATALLSLIQSEMSVDQVLAYFQIFRLWGHPMIDYEKGLKKLHDRTHETLPCDKEYAKKLGSDLIKRVLIGLFKREKRWYVDLDKLDANNPAYKTFQTQSKMKRKVIDALGDTWQSLPITAPFSVPEYINLPDLFNDKVHCGTRSEFISELTRLERKNGLLSEGLTKTKSTNRKVLETLLKTPHINIKKFLQDIDSKSLPDEDMIISLQEKERELNIFGRFFAVMTFNLRLYTVVTEYLIKKFIMPFFPELTLKCSTNKVQELILQAVEGQRLNNSNEIVISNMIDYDKWNQRKRKESSHYTFSAMDSLMGFTNVINRTHEFLNRAWFYYGSRIDQIGLTSNNTPISLNPSVPVLWTDQLGGQEGVRQTGWSITDILIIWRELKDSRIKFRLLVQGDDQILCFHFPIAWNQKEDIHKYNMEITKFASLTERYIKKIFKRSESLGFKVNLEETIVSPDFGVYNKQFVFLEKLLSLPQKRWSRILCLNNDDQMTLSKIMTAVSSTSLSLCQSSDSIQEPIINFLFFSLFSVYVLKDYHPLIKSRIELYQVNPSEKFKHKHSVRLQEVLCKTLYWDSSLGGPSGLVLNTFLSRGSPDPVTKALSFYKKIFLSTDDASVRRVMTECSNPKIKEVTAHSLEMLLENPTALNIEKVVTGTEMITEAIREALYNDRHNIKNDLIREAIQVTTEIEQSAKQYFLSIEPTHPKFLAKFYDSTGAGRVKSIGKMFERGRSIRKTVKDRAHKDLEATGIKSELQCFHRLASTQCCCGIVADRCSKTYADFLRKTSYRRQIIGVTTADPYESLNLNPPAGCLDGTSCANSSLKIEVYFPFGLPKEKYDAGRLKPYIGSTTSEIMGLQNHWEKNTEVPILEMASAMRNYVGWLVAPGSHLHKTILNNLYSLTGIDWSEQIYTQLDIQRNSVMRVTSPKADHGSSCACSLNYPRFCSILTEDFLQSAESFCSFMFQPQMLASQQVAIERSIVNKETVLNYHFHIQCEGCINSTDMSQVLESPKIFEFPQMQKLIQSLHNEAQVMTRSKAPSLHILTDVNADLHSSSYSIFYLINQLYALECPGDSFQTKKDLAFVSSKKQRITLMDISVALHVVSILSSLRKIVTYQNLPNDFIMILSIMRKLYSETLMGLSKNLDVSSLLLRSSVKRELSSRLQISLNHYPIDKHELGEMLLTFVKTEFYLTKNHPQLREHFSQHSRIYLDISLYSNLQLCHLISIYELLPNFIHPMKKDRVETNISSLMMLAREVLNSVRNQDSYEFAPNNIFNYTYCGLIFNSQKLLRLEDVSKNFFLPYDTVENCKISPSKTELISSKVKTKKQSAESRSGVIQKPELMSNCPISIEKEIYDKRVYSLIADQVISHSLSDLFFIVNDPSFQVSYNVMVQKNNQASLCSHTPFEDPPENSLGYRPQLPLNLSRIPCVEEKLKTLRRAHVLASYQTLLEICTDLLCNYGKKNEHKQLSLICLSGSKVHNFIEECFDKDVFEFLKKKQVNQIHIYMSLSSYLLCLSILPKEIVFDCHLSLFEVQTGVLYQMTLFLTPRPKRLTYDMVKLSEFASFGMYLSRLSMSFSHLEFDESSSTLSGHKAKIFLETWSCAQKFFSGLPWGTWMTDAVFEFEEVVGQSSSIASLFFTKFDRYLNSFEIEKEPCGILCLLARSIVRLFLISRFILSSINGCNSLIAFSEIRGTIAPTWTTTTKPRNRVYFSDCPSSTLVNLSLEPDLINHGFHFLKKLAVLDSVTSWDGFSIWLSTKLLSHVLFRGLQEDSLKH